MINPSPDHLSLIGLISMLEYDTVHYPLRWEFYHKKTEKVNLSKLSLVHRNLFILAIVWRKVVV